MRHRELSDGMHIPGATNRPWVVVNMAMSADGKIATANRRLETFGTPRDHEELLRLRAGVDAVMCGARTAGGEGINLNSGGPGWVRLRRRRGLEPEPLRVIVSGRGRIEPDAEVFRSPGGPLVVVVAERARPARVARLRKVAAQVVVRGRDGVDLRAVLAWLRTERGVRRLVCEGGADLNDAMFRAGLVDELRLTVCPVVVGGRTAPTIADGVGVARLAAATRLTLAHRRRIGDELFLTFRVSPPQGG